ncbi:unnamed protein product [Amoebophrya sp. A25]|nr:unnamed protein product [Amoebophrya sp. A25]CAD7977068.1 unnamed protein product [Amoebophrya sp. A25]|eukprot:GSA25T00027907001.1
MNRNYLYSGDYSCTRGFFPDPVQSSSPSSNFLNLRAHLIKTVKDIPGRRVMSMLLSKRMRVMRNLYKTDFLLYKHVCEELGLRMVRFAVPEFRDPSKMVSPMAVDGDKMKWLIRQKLYKKKNMPMMFMDATRTFTGRRASTLVRHTRHPLEPVPEDHGKPKATVQQLSPHFPYGVRADRVRGEQVVHNPTAPGPGYCVGRMK